MITHNREFFSKYMTAPVAFSVLDTLRVRWSSPLRFNDPFDLQTEIRFGFTTEEFMKELAAEVVRVVFQDTEPQGDERNFIFRMMKGMWARRDSLPRDEVVRVMSEPFETGGREMGGRILKLWNQQWRVEASQLRLFCVAEEHDDLLMWAHYAARHTGVVMKLRCVPALDTALCAALPVQYADTLPVLSELGPWVKRMTGQSKDEVGRDIFTRFLCTKSRHWAYEKEWRLPSMGKPDAGRGYVLLGLLPEEIDTLYLGCRMSARNKVKIRDRVKGRLAHVKLFEAKRSDSRYELEFTRIL